MNMATKQQIIRERLSEYLAASRKRKSEILTAVCEATGMERKSVIDRFATLQKRPTWWKDKRHGIIRYGKDTLAALFDVWEIA